jgi:hypothetical protein
MMPFCNPSRLYLRTIGLLMSLQLSASHSGRLKFDNSYKMPRGRDTGNISYYFGYAGHAPRFDLPSV